jgi:hypothetical protein
MAPAPTSAPPLLYCIFSVQIYAAEPKLNGATAYSLARAVGAGAIWARAAAIRTGDLQLPEHKKAGAAS